MLVGGLLAWTIPDIPERVGNFPVIAGRKLKPLKTLES